MKKIVLIDDEEDVCRSLETMLSLDGYEVTWTTKAKRALKTVQEVNPSCVLLDLMMPDGNGLEVLNEILAFDRTLPVIMLTAFDTVKTAVQAIRDGAFHYMAKPYDRSELLVFVEKAFERRGMHLKLIDMKARLGEVDNLEDLFGSSQVMARVIRSIHAVARTSANVLLLGESGTGKEVTARALHHLSDRKNRPFITVDCASIPQNLIESILFGHQKGAFTDALSVQLGKFEIADGGTLFLDEIGNIPMTTQAKLLRFLETREVDRLGSTRTTKVSVRIIAATNADLEARARDGSFRSDLFYRLNEFPVHLPSLKDRPEDIPALCARIMSVMHTEGDTRVTEIAPEAMERLSVYDFPGNVRELKNILKRAALLAHKRVETHNLPENLQHLDLANVKKTFVVSVPKNTELKETCQLAVTQIETEMISEALRRSGQHFGKAASILGIVPRTLYNKMKELKLHPAESNFEEV